MHETSALWKQILAESDHRKEIKVTINGTEYPPEADRLIRASIVGKLFDAPGVGNAFSRTLDLEIVPYDGASGKIPPMSEIRLYVRLVSADGQRVSEYIPKGVFYADTAKRDSDTGAVTVTAFDAMMKAEALFGEPVSDGKGGYEPVRYFTVSFNNGFRNVQKFRVASGDALPTPTTPTHDGERFLAWYPDPANTPTVKGDLRFTAQWTRKFAVAFDSNGGTPQTPQTFVCFEGDPTPTPTTPEKAGYALSGWAPTPTDTVTADATYTAQWEWKRYVIASYPAKSDYAVGETLDYAGLAVEERFEDGAAARDITADCAITPAEGYEITEAGDIMVSVSYNGAMVGTFWAAVNTAYGDWWRLRGDGTLEIFCVGDMPDYSYSDGAPWRSNGANITGVLIGDRVTHIGKYAFHYCSSLTSVTIPDSVTFIGEDAFRGCTSLTSVTIPDSVTSINDDTFLECSGLTSVTIPDSVTYIGIGAFNGCASLTSVTIPDSVTKIGQSAFFRCNSLISVTILGNTTSIEAHAFSRCHNLTNFTIPGNTEYIMGGVFEGCYRLTSVTIPDSMIIIYEDAFNQCYGLTDVYYNGTEAQWDTIKIRSGNSYLHSATKHYNSTGPT